MKHQLLVRMNRIKQQLAIDVQGKTITIAIMVKFALQLVIKLTGCY